MQCPAPFQLLETRLGGPHSRVRDQDLIATGQQFSIHPVSPSLEQSHFSIYLSIHLSIHPCIKRQHNRRTWSVLSPADTSALRSSNECTSSNTLSRSAYLGTDSTSRKKRSAIPNPDGW
eukprot:2551149-Rhodomonas_salina.1